MPHNINATKVELDLTQMRREVTAAMSTAIDSMEDAFQGVQDARRKDASAIRYAARRLANVSEYLNQVANLHYALNMEGREFSITQEGKKHEV